MKFSVFKIMLAVTLICATQFGFGQYVTRHTVDSASANDTRYITWTSTPDDVAGVQLTVTKVSGTLAATVTLETRIDTVSTLWYTIPNSSFTVTDAASQVNIWVTNPQYGNGYRLKVVATSGTQKAYYYAAYLKRTR